LVIPPPLDFKASSAEESTCLHRKSLSPTIGARIDHSHNRLQTQKSSPGSYSEDVNGTQSSDSLDSLDSSGGGIVNPNNMPVPTPRNKDEQDKSTTSDTSMQDVVSPDLIAENDQDVVSPDLIQLVSDYGDNTELVSDIDPQAAPQDQRKLSSVRRCRALYDCDADNDDELNFVEGEIMVIVREEEEEWWEGYVESQPSRRGVFPTTFVQLLPD